MIKWLWTKDKEWFDKWDVFNSTVERGHYLQYSDWLYSYKVYGFEVELLVGLENDEICIGYGIIKAKFSIFKFYVINCGPIVKEGFESYIDESIRIFLEKARKERACYCHINIPVAKEDYSWFCLPKETLNSDSIYFTGKTLGKGFPFKYVASINGFSWVDLPQISEEERLSQFNTGRRKAIRVSLRSGLTVVEAKTPDEIRQAYNACELNANDKGGYILRPWKEFQKYLLPLHEKGYAEFFMAFKDNDCKGALFVIKLNNRYHSNFGGFKREKPDLQAGSFLHWYVIRKAMKQNMPVYDNSVGGSKSVREFKDSFSPVISNFIDGRYWILSPFKYSIYNAFIPWISKNKKRVSWILKFFR